MAATVQKDNGVTFRFENLGRQYAHLILSKSHSKWSELISQLMEAFIQPFQIPRFSSIALPERVFIFDECQPLKFFELKNDNCSWKEFHDACQKLYFITGALDVAFCQYHGTIPVEAIFEYLNIAVVICINEKFPNETADSRVMILDNVFKILDILFRSCGPNLKMFDAYINHIIMSIIEWFKSKCKGITAAYLIEIRSLTYRFISEYFRSFKVNICLSENQTKLLLENLLQDLKMNETVVKISNGKSIQHQATTTITIVNDDVADDKNKKRLENLTIAAGHCINSILRYSNILLDEDDFLKIQKSIISILLEIYNNNYSYYNLPNQYRNVKCREELLKTINLIILNVDSCDEISLETIASILEQAKLLDNCKSISEIVADSQKLFYLISSSQIPLSNARNEQKISEKKPFSDLYEIESESPEEGEILTDTDLVPKDMEISFGKKIENITIPESSAKRNNQITSRDDKSNKKLKVTEEIPRKPEIIIELSEEESDGGGGGEKNERVEIQDVEYIPFPPSSFPAAASVEPQNSTIPNSFEKILEFFHPE